MWRPKVRTRSSQAWGRRVGREAVVFAEAVDQRRHIGGELGRPSGRPAAGGGRAERSGSLRAASRRSRIIRSQRR